MREPIYRPRAAFDLESIIIYVGEVCRNPAAARQTYTSIKEAVKELCAMPTLGRPFIDEALGRRDIRSWLVGNYRVILHLRRGILHGSPRHHTRQDIDRLRPYRWEGRRG